MNAAALLAGMALVGPGTRHVAFPARPALAEVAVHAFLLDREPVTNADFLAFVVAHPDWRREEVSLAFADSGYLADWASPTSTGDLDPRAPVTRVSWFAADAYCAARGDRLPTVDEWELAAQASATSVDGRQDPAWLQTVLDWYARPSPARLPAVGGAPNAWGVADLHGLVWEWTDDFSSDMPQAGAFACGGAPSSASAKDDYAAYMRTAFRSALRADYTVANLGFRCARDVEAR